MQKYQLTITNIPPEILAWIGVHCTPNTILRLRNTCRHLRISVKPILVATGGPWHQLYKGEHRHVWMQTYPPQYIQELDIWSNDYGGIKTVDTRFDGFVDYVGGLTALTSLKLVNSSYGDKRPLDLLVANLPEKEKLEKLFAHSADEVGHCGVFGVNLLLSTFPNLVELKLQHLLTGFAGIGSLSHLRKLELYGILDEEKAEYSTSSDLKSADFSGLISLEEVSLIGFHVSHTMKLWNTFPVNLLKVAKVMPFKNDEYLNEEDELDNLPANVKSLRTSLHVKQQHCDIIVEFPDEGEELDNFYSDSDHWLKHSRATADQAAFVAGESNGNADFDGTYACTANVEAAMEAYFNGCQWAVLNDENYTDPQGLVTFCQSHGITLPPLSLVSPLSISEAPSMSSTISDQFDTITTSTTPTTTTKTSTTTKSATFVTVSSALQQNNGGGGSGFVLSQPAQIAIGVIGVLFLFLLGTCCYVYLRGRRFERTGTIGDSGVTLAPYHFRHRHGGGTTGNNPANFNSPLNMNNPANFNSPLNMNNPANFNSPLNINNPANFNSPLNMSNPANFNSPFNMSNPANFSGMGGGFGR
ncbi:hypothetical protein HK100_002946 [Physocladia obscura]|uniref:F-box domain-containing protein n=1 Tax=Physocladia obscura TaxID=109957 RepID=A0AAD5SV20_9FUNG|nr:hypothetical protein HK100_002946 [Physocladia obscura]